MTKRIPQGNDTVRRAYEDSKRPRPKTARGMPVVENDAEVARFRRVPDVENDPETRNHLIARDGEKPLNLRGRLIGQGKAVRRASDGERGTEVSIYVAASSGKLVTAVHQWQNTDDRQRERHGAAVHEDAEDALAWLKDDPTFGGGGHLGSASQRAWMQACRVYPPMMDGGTEDVD